MLFMSLGAVSVVVVMVLLRRRRATSNPGGGQHGWMSERWLAEHRASHYPES